MEREAIGDPRHERALLERAAEVLGRGGLVGLPAETVYGIAARADDAEALHRLRRAKGAADDLALTWHVASADALELFPSVSTMARRLAARYWPGPLTLVLPGVPAGLEPAAQDGWTGVRAPAHAFTSTLIGALPFPIALSGAHRAGEPPTGEPDDVARRFGETVELLVDGGRTRMGEPSCVLRLGHGRFELLRPGLFTLEQLRGAAGLRIAFVCTGNTCRSPMAEGLARKLLAERLEVRPQRLETLGFEVASMGVHAPVGAPASELSVAVMRDAGVDLEAHRARAAVLEDVLRQDRAYCMTRSHRDALLALLPPGRGRHVELLDPDGRDIPDPIGGTRADYQRAAQSIERAVRARLDAWA